LFPPDGRPLPTPRSPKSCADGYAIKVPSTGRHFYASEQKLLRQEFDAAEAPRRLGIRPER
jgi:hypothetical protein